MSGLFKSDPVDASQRQLFPGNAPTIPLCGTKMKAAQKTHWQL
jgi:hypothetical protein